MGKIQGKRHFILILAGIILSIAGVFSLFASSALALTDAQCEAWALEIKNRVEEIANDPDFVPGTSRGNSPCPNLCLVPDPEDAQYTVNPFLREPAGVLAATIIDVLNSPGDTIFGANVQGISAFFCAQVVNQTTNFTSAVVAVGHSAPTSCGTGFTEVCRATLSSPIPIQ